jgi:hypothetical protein
VIVKVNPILRGWVQYFADRLLEPVFLLYPRVGRKEDPETSGSRVPTSRLRLEAWSQKWLYATLGLFWRCRVSYHPLASLVVPVG